MIQSESIFVLIILIMHFINLLTEKLNFDKLPKIGSGIALPQRRNNFYRHTKSCKNNPISLA